MTEFRIKLPATSANLGPAFDAAALAVGLALDVHAEKSREYSIRAIGRDPEICGELENHLIVRTYQEVLADEKKSELPLALKINNGFPIGKGLGSSAAARLAGIALAVHFGRLKWTSARIIGEPTQPGTETASGIPLDDDALTAAHKTLPLGSKVKVETEVLKLNGRLSCGIQDYVRFTTGPTSRLS